MIKTSAPGKVILFGEHAVVYDKLGIASSVDRRSFVDIVPGENDIIFENKTLECTRHISEKELLDLFDKIDELKKKKDFNGIKEIHKAQKLNASFFVIATLVKRYGFKPMRLIISSGVPKNLGSGSSAFAAIAMAVAKFLGKDLTKKEIAELALEGDIVAHGGTPSGIDSSAVTYGGYLKYRKSEGITPLDSEFELPLVFIDSGEQANTSETVPYIRKQREENQKFVDTILDRLEKISSEAMDALKMKNLNFLGELMLDYYIELKKLNISTQKLDRIVEIAIQSKALGAKPTGGWGGGCCIALAKDRMHAEFLVDNFKKHGFDAFQAKTGVTGVCEIK